MSASDWPVTAVIVTYRSEDTIGPLLDQAKVAWEAGFMRCIVVENADLDGTVEFIRREHPWVDLRVNERNQGFGRGCNRGLFATETRYVLFLNPDAVMQLDDLVTLVEFLDGNPGVGIVGPAIRRAAGPLQEAGCMPTPGSMLGAVSGRGAGNEECRTIEPGSEPFRTSWVCGAALMGRTELLKEIGGFDPRYFLYFEESDLCRRVADHGFEIWAVGTACADHASNASARKVRPGLPAGGCLPEHFFPSRLYYLKKNFGWAAAIGVEIGEIALKAVRDAARFLLRRPDGGELRERLEGPVLRLPPRAPSDPTGVR